MSPDLMALATTAGPAAAQAVRRDVARIKTVLNAKAADAAK